MGRSDRRIRRAAKKANLQARLRQPARVVDIVKVMRDHNWRRHTPWWRKLWIRRRQHVQAVSVIIKWAHSRLLDTRRPR